MGETGSLRLAPEMGRLCSGMWSSWRGLRVSRRAPPEEVAMTQQHGVAVWRPHNLSTVAPLLFLSFCYLSSECTMLPY
jgi:hypothetical protein